MRNAGPAVTITTAAGWVGLVLFLGWQEFFAETGYKWPTVWWFRIPATLALELVILVFALECLMQEMTVRRWATSVLVFGIFGALFLAAGIFNPDTLGLSRWALIPGGVFYLGAAALAGASAREIL